MEVVDMVFRIGRWVETNFGTYRWLVEHMVTGIHILGARKYVCVAGYRDAKTRECWNMWVLRDDEGTVTCARCCKDRQRNGFGMRSRRGHTVIASILQYMHR